jgi:hypothetical protein
MSNSSLNIDFSCLGGVCRLYPSIPPAISSRLSHSSHVVLGWVVFYALACGGTQMEFILQPRTHIEKAGLLWYDRNEVVFRGYIDRLPRFETRYKEAKQT